MKSKNPLSGRERLMEAALELAATTRSIASLGLREVARHAGLNPNTFYRHFRDFDELGVAMLAELGTALRSGLRERRMQPAQKGFRMADFSSPAEGLQEAQAIARESVGLVLDFVTEHREAYTVGVRELYGSSPVMRKAMQDLLEGIAQDMTEDLMEVLKLPGVTSAELIEIARIIVRQMVFFSMDYLEEEARRPEIRRQAERFILLLFWGAIAARSPELLKDPALRFPTF
ncbi:TetR family transcriptional regulator [Flagellatimonas centrodinii]|uniref:TetR family transcriptional regulator n=1 Tax=Flagellatimonas centrodinii TaxID=2806210 RepID=UPI001FEDD7BC|nr:TetR family transcriptional regulator [Flagellatimonas centrodinii]ULQ45505.1 TetR family transcriptional regulator [Flagellatimonas centrodinii]